VIRSRPPIHEDDHTDLLARCGRVGGLDEQWLADGM
jgi:hypothetical protein